MTCNNLKMLVLAAVAVMALVAVSAATVYRVHMSFLFMEL
jgi:hypothetical protein